MPTTRRVTNLPGHPTVMVNLIEHLRQIRDGLIFRQHFQSAVFLSDKILALNPATEDIFVLAKCLYRLKEYQRAAYIITCRNLHRADISCCFLVIKCFVRVFEKSFANLISTLLLLQFKCKKYIEASELAKNILSKNDKIDHKSEMV